MRRSWTACMAIVMCLALTGLPTVAQDSSPSATSSAEATVEPLFEITLGADALPQDLSGVLVFRKIYPLGGEISYGTGFIPPNSFVRYVESGSLGLKPHSEMTVIRDASTAAVVEDVPAESETSVGPGDVFALLDVPYDEYGKDALGTMWHEGTEDAQVVGFAIRESSRCCSMTHSGMRSPWYATLSGDKLNAMIGQPISVTMRRMHLEPGASLSQARWTADDVARGCRRRGRQRSPGGAGWQDDVDGLPHRHLVLRPHLPRRRRADRDQQRHRAGHTHGDGDRAGGVGLERDFSADLSKGSRSNEEPAR